MKGWAQPADIASILEVASRLRNADRMEVAANRGPDVAMETALLDAFYNSDDCGVYCGPKPEAVFGIRVKDGEGTIWALGSEWLVRHPVEMTRQTKNILCNWASAYSVHLFKNKVFEENKQHVKWLGLLGAKFTGRRGRFIFFEIEKDRLSV